MTEAIQAQSWDELVAQFTALHREAAERVATEVYIAAMAEFDFPYAINPVEVASELRKGFIEMALRLGVEPNTRLAHRLWFTTVAAFFARYHRLAEAGERAGGQA
jgi:hypothetical protein